jgi:hypothetical protein
LVWSLVYRPWTLKGYPALGGIEPKLGMADSLHSLHDGLRKPHLRSRLRFWECGKVTWSNPRIATEAVGKKIFADRYLFRTNKAENVVACSHIQPH